MADNYLEKKMEQHKMRATAAASAKRVSLSTLLENSVARDAFDGYSVREDQLLRIVNAATKVAVDMPFRFRLIAGDEAVNLRSADAQLVRATAYVAVCTLEEPDMFLAGRVVQAMLLQAAEIGLSGSLVSGGELVVSNLLHLQMPVVVLLAFGRNAEPSLLFENVAGDSGASDLIIK